MSLYYYSVKLHGIVNPEVIAKLQEIGIPVAIAKLQGMVSLRS